MTDIGAQYIEPVLFATSRRSENSASLAAALRLPSLCAVCHDWGRQRVCDLCLDRYASAKPRCRRCALTVPAGVNVCGTCLVEPPPWVGTVAAVDYGHPWDGLVSRFKFHGGLDLTAVLAGRMLQAHRDAGLPTPALLLPVPLSDARLRERGYNQAWELTRRLARRLGCGADADLLLRTRDTAHQLALAPDRRAGNVQAAFSIEPRRRGELGGREVTLVDDVMTTGATAAEITRVLLQAGATAVRVWVIARTPRPGDDA